MGSAGVRVTWVLVAAVIALHVAGELVLAIAGSLTDGGSVATGIAFTALAAVFLVVGALVATRLPANPVGWLLCGAGALLTVTSLTSGYAAVTLDAVTGAGPAGGVLAAWITSWSWTPVVLGFPPLLVLLFPDGRPVTPRWRHVRWLVAVGLGSVLAGSALAEGGLTNSPSPETPNPLGLLPRSAADALTAFGFIVALAALAVALASMVVRLRRARPTERQQLKWLMWSTLFLPLYLGFGLVVWSSDAPESALADVVGAACLSVVPLAVGTAILRHRLYDIDVVIHRSLVYGALTVTLGTTYLVSVLVLRVTLDPLTNDSDLAVAASTLAVAALFRPLRTRIQSLVDRRFYRARYDAARTLDRFATHLRDQLDLRSLQDDLCGVVRDTVHPTRVSLWMRGSAR